MIQSIQNDIKIKKMEGLSDRILEWASKNEIDVISYMDLKNCAKLEDIFQNFRFIILHLPVSDLNTGHYVAIWIKNGTFMYFDSYGLSTEKDIIKSDYVMRQGVETINMLPRLIADYQRRGGKFSYNSYKFQDYKNEGISTCGPHCLVRLKNANLDHHEYNEYFKFKGIDRDSLVSLMTWII